MQLCKQTTQNPEVASCARGWELLAIALSFFPPSAKFFSYLEGYLSQHYGDPSDGFHGQVTLYCVKRLERAGKMGAKRGANAPTLEEIEQAQHSILNPSVFGSTVEENMVIQAVLHPGTRGGVTVNPNSTHCVFVSLSLPCRTTHPVGCGGAVQGRVEARGRQNRGHLPRPWRY
jgi:hypothetical protein